MLAMERKPVDFTHDISYYAKDSRLTGEPDGKRYKWTEMIKRFKMDLLQDYYLAKPAEMPLPISQEALRIIENYEK